MLEGSQRLFGGSQSEGGKAFTAKTLDFAMYASTLSKTPQKNKIFDAYLPIWFITFNGYVISNPSNATVNFPIKPVDDILTMPELAGRPLFYFYSSFKSKMKDNWMGGTLDLRCATDAELDYAVEQIKKGYDIFQQYKGLLKETIVDHRELAPQVKCTTFSNGRKTICNYGKSPYTYKGITIPAESFKVI